MADEVVRTEVVVLSRTELADLVTQAVMQALDAYVAQQPPAERLLRASEMAARLSISEQQLGIFCREGCPHALVGDRHRRFEPELVIAWLNERGAPARV